ncbi:hypothetical protein EV359DRAFT_47787 [Lentinula novae-zelandiae]|nr:hypothetical protein EV359DRAFT_47787 [Lentinula novae-zelandiae]
MIGISMLMFFIATWHLAMNAYRMVEGYVDHSLAPGGAVAYIGDLRPWHHILKDTLYATQENLGSAAAIYRCWVLWSHNWKIIMFPSMLLMVNIGRYRLQFLSVISLIVVKPLSLVAGYMVCGLYSTVSPTETVFDARLTTWIKIFYSLAVVLNIITTSLMSYRIWHTHQQSSTYVSSSSQLMPIMRILVESAALQLFVETVLLALYSNDINAQYILLESAITFNAITIRIKLQSISMGGGSKFSSNGATQTIGSMPMRRIQVNIAQDIGIEEGDDMLTLTK